METICSLPAILPAKSRRKYPATLGEVVRMASDKQAILPVLGDCMEAAGIADGGFTAVDFTRCPRPARMEDGKRIHGDPCLCYARYRKSTPPAIMCKEYLGGWIGQTVGTRYVRWKDGELRMDCAFPAEAILGVVFASWGPDGRLIWQRDPTEFPTELQSPRPVESDGYFKFRIDP